ncbi:hypothetical protein TNCV_3459501 [Trichonephila clavipes]|nr:hypothetical protein TNCV_3459501 [Trichonephila clavipes]
MSNLYPKSFPLEDPNLCGKKISYQCSICDTADREGQRVDFTADSHCGKTPSSKRERGPAGLVVASRAVKANGPRGFYIQSIPWYRKRLTIG